MINTKAYVNDLELHEPQGLTSVARHQKLVENL